MNTDRFRTGVAVGFVTAIILAAFWKVTLMRGLVITDDIFASDLMNENFPYRFALGNALHAGHWPLWIREIYGGFPLLARSEAGVCYPFNLILFGLFSPYVALNLTILLLLVTAAVGMYFYAREVGGTPLAATMAGIAFGFSGFLLSHLKHLSIANAACWLPVALTLLERAVRRNTARPLLWFGLVFGLQHLSGNAQTAYYCGALYLVYFPLRLLNRRKETRASETGAKANPARLAGPFAGALILGSLLAAVQLLPTYELVSFSQRSGGVTFEYASNYAYDPKSFWTFFYPYSSGDIGDLSYTGSGVFWEDYGYVGLATVLLALSAPLTWWKSWHVRFFSFTALASYVLVLGPATPAYELAFKHIPGMNYFRFPTRLLLVTDLSLIVLASLGLTRLALRLGAARRASLVQAVILLLTVGDLLYFQLRQNPIVDAAVWKQTPTTVGILRQDPSLFRVFCVGGNHAHKKAFEAAGWEGDLQAFVDQREFIQPSSNVLYGISSPNGYANLTPNNLVDVWGDQNRAGIITRTASTENDFFAPTPAFWKLMRMYNVKYLTSFWPFLAAPNLHPLGLYGGAYLYRHDEVMPRAYLVGEVVPVADERTALVTLLSDDFDPARSVLLETVPPTYQPRSPAGAPGVGKVDFLSYTPQQAELQVKADKDAILVFSDSYYPGWVADVDGREIPIYRANVTQRAVVVPGGEHRIRFRFKPVTVIVGLWVSIGALVVLLGWFLIPLGYRDRGREV